MTDWLKAILGLLAAGIAVALFADRATGNGTPQSPVTLSGRIQSRLGNIQVTEFTDAQLGLNPGFNQRERIDRVNEAVEDGADYDDWVGGL